MHHRHPLHRRHLLTALAVTCWPWAEGRAEARAMPPGARSHFPPQLAREAPDDVDPQGFLVSEKLDGVRALWDGQSLRSRSGRPIAAPAWFTRALPAQALDGELWAGRRRFDAVSGTVRRARPLDADWRAVRYAVFDLPGAPGPFAQRAARVQHWSASAALPHCLAVQQRVVPNRQALLRQLESLVQAGGEGLMLHRASALWQSGRSGQVLKLKPVHDAEATVLGHQAGQGRYSGQLGALRVRSDAGVLFEIGTGFSDAERIRPPAVGARISYSHRGHTPGGVPRFASFLRVRDD